MKSPHSDEAMLVLELSGVEIDYCPLTHGIWLDAGELETLFNDRAEAEKLIASFKIDNNNREKKIRCPICNRKMEKVLVENKVLIDRCFKGHGLWFDRGELQRILELGKGDGNEKVITLLKEMFAYNLKNSK